MTLRMEQIYTLIAACVITSINGEKCIDAPLYSGTLNVTLSGYTCQRWDSQQPHQHTRNTSNNFPNDRSVEDAHNYCRDPDGSYELWCYTTDTEKRWEPCVRISGICSVVTDFANCQTLPENKKSTHCPNDTSVYLCLQSGESEYIFINILYHMECDNYVCCPIFPETTYYSVTFLSSTDNPGPTLTSLLNSTIKDQNPFSDQVEGSKLPANDFAENSTRFSSGNGWICSFYLFQFILFMALLSCSFMYQK